MLINLLKSKIHRAVVTEANLNYAGSISIDATLMEAANLSEFENVHILNITNGERLITYAIKAPKNSGQVCVNGAAAHLAGRGDIIIVVSYCFIHKNEVTNHAPAIVHVNEQNKIAR